jgi:hypothetical protein
MVRRGLGRFVRNDGVGGDAVKSVITVKCADGHISRINVMGANDFQYMDSLVEMLRLGCNVIRKGCEWKEGEAKPCHAHVDVSWESVDRFPDECDEDSQQ